MEWIRKMYTLDTYALALITIWCKLAIGIISSLVLLTLWYNVVTGIGYSYHFEFQLYSQLRPEWMDRQRVRLRPYLKTLNVNYNIFTIQNRRKKFYRIGQIKNVLAGVCTLKLLRWIFQTWLQILESEKSFQPWRHCIAWGVAG